MINKFFLLTIKGLLTILPFVLTIYLLYWLVMTAENLLSPHLPEQFYFPGLGVITAILLLACIGALVNAYIVSSIIAWGQGFLERLPIIKTLFGAIKDAVDLFQTKNEKGTKRAVSVEVAEGVILIGFVTNDQVANALFPNQDKVAVYLPFSYQIGGYTLYLDKSKISELDIDVETAMRIAVTGGNSITTTD